jgi:hypothetical protein
VDTNNAHAISEDAAPLDANVRDGEIAKKLRRSKRYELSNLSPEGNMSEHELRRKHTISPAAPPAPAAPSAT